jgi:hypothetical protein
MSVGAASLAASAEPELGSNDRYSQLNLHRPRATMPSGASTNTASDGIYGWYRYIQDFTGDFALDWLKSIARPGDLIWEPFAGSGTTLVAAKSLGYESIGFEMNPFMVDVARVKLDWSTPIRGLLRSLERVLTDLDAERLAEPVETVKGTWKDYESHTVDGWETYPEDKKLRRWISPAVLRRVQNLLVRLELEDRRERSFLRLAAASIMIPASNMTFRPNICYESRPNLDYPVLAEFEARARGMIEDFRAVAGRGHPKSVVKQGDARIDGPNVAQVIFTSPPYPNDMEYVHQTRLELALLGYVHERTDLTRLKKQMLSSSVKLVYRENEWQKEDGLGLDGVADVYRQVAATLEGKNWGWNPADMIAQYFGGMRTVTRNWHQRLSPGGTAAVVIGDSAFNGVKIPTDELLAETAEREGFVCDGIEVFRTRWNTKHGIELRESVVVLRKLG